MIRTSHTLQEIALQILLMQAHLLHRDARLGENLPHRPGHEAALRQNRDAH